MATQHRALMIGAGNFATRWMTAFLPAFRDRLDIVGLVDRDPIALARGAANLGLDADATFTNMATGFASVDADCCLITVTPAAHEEAVMLAIEHGMAILSEKPISDTWDACLRIRDAVVAANARMQVIQNYRYTPPLQTMARILKEGTLGRPNTVIARFADDYREPNSWGAPFRHQIPHALLVEGAVHHFDSIRLLTAANCERIAGWEWNPPWSTSQGAFCATYAMQMSNEVYASYEGNGVEAGRQYGWHHEAYRVECEHGAIAVDHDRTVRIYRHTAGSGLRIDELPPVKLAFTGHQWLINEFLDWLDGGPTPETELQDNLQSVAMVFAAIQASQTDRTVRVQDMMSRDITETASQAKGIA